MQSTLTIDALTVPIHLGVTEAERATPQIVTLSLAIGFENPPQACATDALQDAIAYDALCEHIKQFCLQQRFALIEAMAQRLYTHLQQWLQKQPPHQRLWLSVCKKPPLADVSSCTFSMGDGHPNTWSS